MIQPLAYVNPEAKIADNVVIEPFVTIHKNVVIEEGSWIGSNVTIMEGARIGKNCRIFPGAVVSAIPQDLKFEGENSILEVGNNVTIRECVTLNRGTKAMGKTKIGDHCLIMAYVHVAHDCMVGDNVILANGVQLAGHVEIDDHTILGGLSAVHQFVKIGKHCMISGGSLVRKDVPPYSKAGREPLGYEGVNSVGLRRRGYDSKTINLIQDVYRWLFLRGLNNTQALRKIEEVVELTKERDEIIQFIKDSDRGIMKGFITHK